MAQRAPFEERFTVISLLLATLDGAFAEYKRMDSYLVSLHGALRQVKMRIEETAGKQRNPAEQSAENRISGMEESCGILRQIIEKRRSSLKVKEEKELIFGEEICREEQVIGSLERCDQTLRREHLREDEKGFERIRELFEQEMLQRRELTERIAKMLRQAFGFVSECFGEEQEMILLVSGLAKSSRAAEFIAAHGCDEYVKYSEILIGHTPEAELRRACREALEE